MRHGKHDALLTLDGPGYHATRLLQLTRGVAGATILLPQKLASGTWTIAVQDISGIKLRAKHKLAGNAIARLGVFQIKNHIQKHRRA